jgi:transmembrane sensor
MNRETFDYLLEKYINNQCTPDEKALVEEWYSLVGSDGALPRNKRDWEVLKSLIWLKIKKRLKDAESPVFFTTFLKFAASVLVLLGLSFLVFRNYNLPLTSSAESLTFRNEGANPKRIRLRDGSVLTLFPRAHLVLAQDFNQTERRVQLNGDAHFEIAHNTQKPFLVETGATITKVIGTSFTIKSNKNETIEVLVNTGRVAVFEKDAEEKRENGVVLTANQKVVFFKEKQLFVTGIVDAPKVVANMDSRNSFVYKNELFSDVITHFEKAYGIEIVFENEALARCQLTGDFTGNTLYDNLDIIGLVLGVSYQIKGTTILIVGKGC